MHRLANAIALHNAGARRGPDLRRELFGNGCLTASAQAADGNETAGLRLQDRPSEFEIGSRLACDRVGGGRVVCGLSGSHVCSDGGADRHEERQEHEAVLVIAFVEIAVCDKVCEVRETPVP